MSASEGSPIRPASRFGRKRAYIILGTIVLAAVVVVAVYRYATPPRTYTLVAGPVPEGSRSIPSVPLDANLTSRLRTDWVTNANAWPPETIYRLLSRRFFLGGEEVVNLFYVPIVWPSFLNLSANNLSLDPSGQYLLIPSESWLLTSGGNLWMYTVLHGITQSPFEENCTCPGGPAPSFGFGLVVREQQYSVTWFTSYQSQHEAILGFDPALPDAFSSPMAWNDSRLAPIIVDRQYVYATGNGGPGLGEAPVPATTFYQPSQNPVDPSGAGGLIVDLTNSTLFLFEIPLTSLPHTSEYVMFSALFLLEFWPPVGATPQRLVADYQPSSGLDPLAPGGPDAWNDTAAYIPFAALLSS